MRFTFAWSEVLNQNITLRVTIACLSFVCLSLTVFLAKALLKDPIVIDRGCYSQAIHPGATERSESEVKAFLREALEQRFDTGTDVKEGYLSSDEIQMKEKEQRELRTNEIRQKVIVNQPIKITGSDAIVDTDRLITVGPVRSAFSFPLSVTISSTKRTETNPYGLKLARVTPVKVKNEK